MEQVLVQILATSVMVLLARPAQGWTDPNDALALSILYSSLEYPELSGWKALGGDPCEESWQGLECVGPNVTAIKLPGLNLGGSLGHALDNFTSLLTLDLSNNNIGQIVPYQLPTHIQALYLDKNQLSGSLPSSFSNLSSLIKLNLSNNLLDSQVPDSFHELSNLISLDLSNNKLTGLLPVSFGSLTSLSTLHLEDNQFSGNIDVLGQLPLQDLDIESNHFSGWIPPSLLKIPSFRYSGNQLNISLASPPPPLTSPPSSQPKGVTGAPPPKRATPPRSPHSKGSSENAQGKNGRHSYWNVRRIVGIVFAVVLSIAAVMILGFFLKQTFQKKEGGEEMKGLKDSSVFYSPEKVYQMEKIEKNNISVTPPQSFLKTSPEKYKAPAERIPGKTLPNRISKIHISAAEYTVAELQLATNSFGQENLIGEGSFGQVYKAKFRNDNLVAIKKLDGTRLSVQNEDEFLATVSILARLRHANIVKLVGYCSEHGQRLLAYEYIGAVTLHNLLHDKHESNHTKISWNVRVKIALGVARALEYLHEICLPAVVHKNFKCANILLDDNFEPHLADCGVATLFHYGHEHQVSAQLLLSLGYSPPEYIMSGIYTAKSDVYGFGVVMLELLTGRKALDSLKPRAEQSLVRWAMPQLHDINALAKMVDPMLEGIYPAKSLSRFADIISICIQPEPEFRPQMSEVVQALVLLMQHASPAERGSGDDLEALTVKTPQTFQHEDSSQ